MKLNFLEPIRRSLTDRGIKFRELRYGDHSVPEYQDLLARSSAMLFLSEHESQGLAYQECLSCGVPVLKLGIRESTLEQTGMS